MSETLNKKKKYTKWDINTVRQKFLDRGYELLSTKYKDNKTSLDYRCPEGHLGKITFKSFSRGSGCRKCSDIKVGDRLRKSFEDVKQAFTDRGYTLLSTEYINTDTPLEYRCPKGHFGKIRFNSFSSGQGCRKCYDIKIGDRSRKSFDDVKQSFTNRGYTLLSTKYKNCMTPLDYRCPSGHLGKITFNSFSRCQGCAKCACIKKADRLRKSFDDVKQAFTKRGYTFLSTKYINNKTPLEYSCQEGHLGKIRLDGFLRGKGCAKCSQSRSEKLTREIFEKIMLTKFPTIRPDFLKNPKTECNLELDGYNENLKLAFEYNGEQHYKFKKHFHRTEEDFKIQREHDEFKYKKCVELGITLISIPYTFDCYYPEKLENFIKDELIKHEFIFFL